MHFESKSSDFSKQKSHIVFYDFHVFPLLSCNLYNPPLMTIHLRRDPNINSSVFCFLFYLNISFYILVYLVRFSFENKNKKILYCSKEFLLSKSNISYSSPTAGVLYFFHNINFL